MTNRAERDYSPGWRRFTEIILPSPIRGLMKLEASGQSYFPAGGMIVAGNHLSYADWPAMALFCYEAGHYPVFTIKSPVFDVKVIGSLMRKLGQLPVYRGRADAALVLKQAEQRIGRGACVIFYPEGTASRDPDQWPMVAKTGVARLALSTGAPVIPVACWGAQVILPYGDKRPRLFPRKTVRIAAGPPVDLSAFAGQPLTADTLRRATDVIMADITGLLGRLRGEQPPAVPYDPRAKRGKAADGQEETVTAQEETVTGQQETVTGQQETAAEREETAAGQATIAGQAEDGRAGAGSAAGDPQAIQDAHAPGTEGAGDPQDTRDADASPGVQAAGGPHSPPDTGGPHDTRKAQQG
jgi:1-acyl-sn-glycerol-3-phosphate acyltransferase